MAKLGKFSTGFGTAQPKHAPYQNSNEGYGGRKALNLHHSENVEMSDSDKGGATGKEIPIKTNPRTAKRTF